jgi:hypothetical protein
MALLPALQEWPASHSSMVVVLGQKRPPLQ